MKTKKNLIYSTHIAYPFSRRLHASSLLCYTIHTRSRCTFRTHTHPHTYATYVYTVYASVRAVVPNINQVSQ